MFQVELLDHSTEKRGAGKDLNLRVQVGGIVIRVIDYDRTALKCSQRGVSIGIDLNPHSGFVDVWLARHVDGHKGGDYCRDSENQPQVTTNRAPVITEVDLTLWSIIHAIATWQGHEPFSDRSILHPAKSRHQVHLSN